MTSISYIEDLSRSDITTLTQLLANTLPNHNPKQWLQDQSTQISTLPSQLLRPKTGLPRLALHLPFTPANAILCPTHKPLNPQLIHRLFLQISAESTIRLARLTSSPELALHPIPPTVASFIQRIQAVNTLWMAPETYAAAFQTPHQPQAGKSGFKMVEGGCEACILAFVGGNKGLLTDLRTAMVGRRRKRRREVPVLWGVVEAWIGWTGEGDEIREESDRIGKEVRVFRRILQLTRRGKPLPEKYRIDANKGMSVVEETVDAEAEVEEGGMRREEGEGGGSGDKEEYEFENEIIDYYRNLISRSTLILPISSPNSSQPHHISTNSNRDLNSPSSVYSTHSLTSSHIHPAFRASLSFNPATGTFERPQIRQSSKPSSSIYSTPPRPANPTPPQSPPPLPPRNPPHPPKASRTPHAFWPLSPTPTIDSGCCSQTTSSQTNLTRTAEKRAQSYRKLVGMPSPSSVNHKLSFSLGDTVENLLMRKGAHRFTSGENGGDGSMSEEKSGGNGDGDGDGSGSNRRTRWSDFYKKS